jgi:hypothetical protein
MGKPIRGVIYVILYVYSESIAAAFRVGQEAVVVTCIPASILQYNVRENTYQNPKFTFQIYKSINGSLLFVP